MSLLNTIQLNIAHPKSLIYYQPLFSTLNKISVNVAEWRVCICISVSYRELNDVKAPGMDCSAD